MFVKSQWSEVYGAMFDEETAREDMRVIFVEYAGDLALDAAVTRKAGA